jgi:hypothetical protein
VGAEHHPVLVGFSQQGAEESIGVWQVLLLQDGLICDKTVTPVAASFLLTTSLRITTQKQNHSNT